MRTINAGGQALLDRLITGEQIPVVPLLYMGLTVPQRWALGGFDVVWGGFTWVARDIGLTPIVQDTGLNGMRFVLPGATEAELALAFDDVEGAEVELRLAFCDPVTAVAEDAMSVFAGQLDVPGWEDGPTATVIFSAEHRGTTALRQRVSRYTDDEQQRLYPGDTSLDFDPGTDKAPIVWPNASYFRV